MNALLLMLAMSLSATAVASSRVRKAEIKQDQIVTVKTAMGIATIIQVPDRPNSIVVGDQAAFKVEYLDQAITIKPLHGGARSNLYIYTDYRRFNVQLITSTEAAADYVVYLENEKEKAKSSRISWSPFRNSLRNEEVSIETKRLAKTRDGVLLIEFEVASSGKVKFKPEWIWLTQNGSTRPIHGLLLSGQALSEKAPIQGVLQILKTDVSASDPIRLELRRNKTSYLTIPKVNSWK